MASGKTLNAANLEALGAARLAGLLLEITTGDAAARRRLRLALAGSLGPAEAAREIAKRLASIAKARTFIERDRIRPLAGELEAQRSAILALVAPADPREAFELTWRLVACSDAVFSRSDDSDGELFEIFRDCARDLGTLARAARLDPADLATRAFAALRDNGHGVCDDLVEHLAPQLGAAGLDRLRQLVEAWKAEKVAALPQRERRVIGWSSSGAIYADQIETNHRRHTASFVLKQIADARGDVDSYVAQVEPRARTMPGPAADIARRLLEAARPQEAWTVLEAVDPKHQHAARSEFEGARIDTLEALGRGADAQACRWQRFVETLDPDHLRAHLRRLPDFEDFEAEQRALDHALGFADAHHALAFLVTWPDLKRASQLVLARAKELDGNHYEVLTPSAEALDEKHPLAATILRRAMIDFALGATRASRYKHAARHLRACAGLAPRVAEFGGRPGHLAYERELRAAHGRKAAFWQEVDALR